MLGSHVHHVKLCGRWIQRGDGDAPDRLTFTVDSHPESTNWPSEVPRFEGIRCRESVASLDLLPQCVAHCPRVRRGRVACDDRNVACHESHQSRPAELDRPHTTQPWSRRLQRLGRKIGRETPVDVHVEWDQRTIWAAPVALDPPPVDASAGSGGWTASRACLSRLPGKRGAAGSESALGAATRRATGGGVL
jgi:hypothetical protein